MKKALAPLLSLYCAAALTAATAVRSDLSLTESLDNAEAAGSTLVLISDSIYYDRVIADALASGTASPGSSPSKQSAWPTLASTSRDRFCFSYIYFKPAAGSEGNYLVEKLYRVFPQAHSVSASYTPSSDSMGTVLSRKIMLLPPSTNTMGGFNAKSLASPDGRVFRLCQAYSGSWDSVYVLDKATVPNGTYFQGLDYPVSGKPYPDYCLNAGGDTIFTVFTPDQKKLCVRPLIPVSVSGHDSIAQGPLRTLVNDGVTRTDLGIAMDPSTGDFLVTCLRNNTNELEATRFSHSFTGVASAVVETGMPLVNALARNIRVEAMGDNRFAVTYWMGVTGGNGVFLQEVEVGPASVTQISRVRLEDGSGVVPSLSYNNGKLAAVWVRDRTGMANDGVLYGKIFQVASGAITDTLFTGEISTDRTVTENFLVPPANFRIAAALDSNGTLMAAYSKFDYRQYVCAWSPVYFFPDSGQAVLLADSLDETGYGGLNSDSIRFSRFAMQDTGSGGSAEIYFRNGTSLPLAGGYTEVDTNTSLAAAVGRYFQIKLKMRPDLSERYRPVITGLSFNYNVRPRAARVDSFSVNNGPDSVVAAGDTIRLRARSDTLLCFASAQDYDDASAITLYYRGFQALSGSMSRAAAKAYAQSTEFAATDHADTVFPLLFSVADTTGWGSDTFRAWVNLRNPAPVLSAWDTVFLFANNTAGTLNDNGMVRFMKRHHVVIRASTLDSNDGANLTYDLLLDGVSRKPVNGDSLALDTVDHGDLPSDTGLYRIRVTDPGGKADSITFTLIAYNDPPSDSLAYLSYDDSEAIKKDTGLSEGDTLYIDEGGYAVVRAFGRDSNENDLDHDLIYNGSILDSGRGMVNFTDTIFARDVQAVDTVAIVVRDSFATDTATFFVRVVHAPRIDRVIYLNGQDTVITRADTLRMRLSVFDSFRVEMTDPDVLVDDSLTVEWFLDEGLDSTHTGTGTVITFTRDADAPESLARFRVTDNTGLRDEVSIFFLYSAFTTGPGFAADSAYFADSIELFVTRRTQAMDDVSAQSRSITFTNTGTDALTIDSVYAKSGRDAEGWIRFGWSTGGAPAVWSPRLATAQRLLKGDTLLLFVRDSAAAAFTGTGVAARSIGQADTVIFDTLVMVTDDPRRPLIELAVRIRCNELPYIVGDTVLFLGDKPALARAAKGAFYTPRNAAYRRIALVFNEYVSRASVTSASFTVYSYDDSLYYAAHGVTAITPLPGFLSWGARDAARQDTLFFIPAYASNGYTSPVYGVSPRDSFFIAADRIRVRVAAAITDLAGNGLDMDDDFLPDPPGAAKSYGARIDSSGFRVVRTTPDSGETGVAKSGAITILFSSILDTRSVDTSRTGNRSIRVFSGFDPSRPFAFTEQPVVSLASLTVRPAVQYLSEDSVVVMLSASLRDTFYSTLDGDRDGRGAFFYLHGTATYAMADTFMGQDRVLGDNYAFWFRAENEEFYFYPCPYEPSRDARHEALNGIVFKNLHALEDDQTARSLNCRVYDAAGDLVYSTYKKKSPIRFRSGGASSQPEWKWDARNSSGRDVASGLYVFVFTDDQDKEVLKQGKLIVIR